MTTLYPAERLRDAQDARDVCLAKVVLARRAGLWAEAWQHWQQKVQLEAQIVRWDAERDRRAS